METINIVLTGVSGRMGQEINQLITEDPSLHLAAGVDHNSNADLDKIEGLSSKGVNSLVDFSSPDIFEEALEWCLNHKIAFISGTTGLTKEHFNHIQSAGQKIPILWAPNMSLGVTMLGKILEQLKVVGEHFHFQVEETHHKDKKDRPSGTALMLQKKLEESLNKRIPEIISKREEGVFGVHKVILSSDDEKICFEHIALNRKVFARGALQAVKWLNSKPAGCYSMEDVLGIKSDG